MRRQPTESSSYRDAMNPHPSEYRETMNRHARRRLRWPERRFAWLGAALAMAALAAGCASAPRTPPDPAVAAALARDGQRLFAAPSPASGVSVEPSAAARDDAPGEDGR